MRATLIRPRFLLGIAILTTFLVTTPATAQEVDLPTTDTPTQADNSGDDGGEGDVADDSPAMRSCAEYATQPFGFLRFLIDFLMALLQFFEDFTNDTDVGANDDPATPEDPAAPSPPESPDAPTSPDPPSSPDAPTTPDGAPVPVNPTAPGTPTFPATPVPPVEPTVPAASDPVNGQGFRGFSSGAVFGR